MPDIEKILLSIGESNYSSKEMMSLYKNTEKYDQRCEYDRESILSAIELQVRKSDTRTANKFFLRLGSKPVELLESFYGQIKEEFDLSKNRVKSGVKAGGPMIAGEMPVYFYLSCKNVNGNGVVARAMQPSLDDEVTYTVYSYKGLNNSENGVDAQSILEGDDSMGVAFRNVLTNLSD